MGQAYICRRGGGAKVPVKSDVNFYDFDGTFVAGYTVEEAQNLTALPKAPNLESRTNVPLVFQQWNYTLAEIKLEARPLDIVAERITADGKTHFNFRPLGTSSGARTLTIRVYKDDTKKLTVNWGDGTTPTENTSTGAQTITHTYSEVASYHVTLSIESGGTYALGYIFDAATASQFATPANALHGELNIGAGVTRLATGAFYASTVKAVSIPSSVQQFYRDVMSNMPLLKLAYMPHGALAVANLEVVHTCRGLAVCSLPRMTNYLATTLDNCSAVERIIVPYGVTSVPTFFARSCYNAVYVDIPSTVTDIGEALGTMSSAVLYIVCRATTPPTLASSAFSDINGASVIAVPNASLNAYKTATNWSAHASKMVGF